MKSIWKSLMVGLILVTCLTSTVFAAETEYDMSAAGDGSVIATFEDTTGVLTRRKWQPTPVFSPGEFQGWGSLVGCHQTSNKAGNCSTSH